MKELEFEQRYFASKEEWEYFLDKCGIEYTDSDDIGTVEISVIDSDITVSH